MNKTKRIEKLEEELRDNSNTIQSLKKSIDVFRNEHRRYDRDRNDNIMAINKHKNNIAELKFRLDKPRVILLSPYGLERITKDSNGNILGTFPMEWDKRYASEDFCTIFKLRYHRIDGNVYELVEDE
jgi:hypothetical protein